MIWLKLLGLWSSVRKLAQAGLSWLTASSTHLLIALCAILALWGAIERRAGAKWQEAAQKCSAARKSDLAAAQKAKADYEAQSKKDADNADQRYNAAVADGGTRLAAYIAAHRVRAGTATPAPSATQDHAPGVPANATTGPVMEAITISEADLKACDASYTYAQAAYEWARGLNKDQ